MLKPAVVEEKLAKLVGFLKELEGIRPMSFEKYKTDPAIKRSCERLIQLIVESAADINSAVITGLGHLPPKDYYDTFIRAGEDRLVFTPLEVRRPEASVPILSGTSNGV